jgi:long-chain acyl-CoA synthetase
MHRSERTVHEQLLTRLASKTRPVSYFDIVQGGLIPRSASEVRDEILASAGALTALGIRPGERVAIVGLNSTRYLALDAAIGLVGAVSVPLYYTPPAELTTSFRAGAALRFRAPKSGRQGHPGRLRCLFCQPHPSWDGVISWDAFQHKQTRYLRRRWIRRSGNTPLYLRPGQPRGWLPHQHLCWLGRTMASCSLEARNRTANPSLLPMSHVVEGILATYCPLPSGGGEHLLFAEESSATLPVRPTIFFSVRRI